MAPTSWAVAVAETIMKRNPGAPGDVLASWSYWKAYTLLGFEMLWRTTGDPRYLEFIKRELDPFVGEQGNLVGVTLDSLDNIMPGSAIVARILEGHRARPQRAGRLFDRLAVERAELERQLQVRRHAA